MSEKNAHEIIDNMELDRNVSENEKNEMMEHEVESTEEVYEQDQETDESKEMHIDEECGCGKPNKVENFKCDDCGKVFCDKCPDAPIGENCLACMIIASGL